MLTTLKNRHIAFYFWEDCHERRIWISCGIIYISSHYDPLLPQLSISGFFLADLGIFVSVTTILHDVCSAAHYDSTDTSMIPLTHLCPICVQHLTVLLYWYITFNVAFDDLYISQVRPLVPNDSAHYPRFLYIKYWNHNSLYIACTLS